jgi:MFS family permease
MDESDGGKAFGRKALALLRAGPFRRYIVGSAFSDTGTWMQNTAQAWVMSTLTNKAILLGVANLAFGLPSLALTMIGGSLADRFDKRKILIATQIAQIVFALCLGWLILAGRIEIWHIIVFAALLGTAFAFEMPALNALVPELVRRDEIGAAVAMDRSVFHGSRLVGSALGGLSIGWRGAASAFFINAFSFLALIVALISLPPRPTGTAEEEEQRRSGIMDGFRYVWKDRIMLSLIVFIALNTIFIFPIISPVMLPLYVRNILHLGPGSLGALMAVSGTGAFLGSIGLLTIAREKRLKFMSGNVVAVALGVFWMSRSHSFWVTACAMGVLAIAISMNFGLANTIAQERAPDVLRGRISAVIALSFFGLMPIAGLIIPGISDLIGMRTALVVASVIFGIAALWILSVAGRHVCDEPISRTPEPEFEPVV